MKHVTKSDEFTGNYGSGNSADLYDLKLRGKIALVESDKDTTCLSCDVKSEVFADEASENLNVFREFPSNFGTFRHTRWSTSYFTAFVSLWIWAPFAELNFSSVTWVSCEISKRRYGRELESDAKLILLQWNILNNASIGKHSWFRS